MYFHLVLRVGTTLPNIYTEAGCNLERFSEAKPHLREGCVKCNSTQLYIFLHSLAVQAQTTQ